MSVKCNVICHNWYESTRQDVITFERPLCIYSLLWHFIWTLQSLPWGKSRVPKTLLHLQEHTVRHFHAQTMLLGTNNTFLMKICGKGCSNWDLRLGGRGRAGQVSRRSSSVRHRHSHLGRQPVRTRSRRDYTYTRTRISKTNMCFQ